MSKRARNTDSRSHQAASGGHTDKLVAELKRRLAAGNWQQGGLYHVLIYHDDACAVFRGDSCNCSPDVELLRDPLPPSAN